MNRLIFILAFVLATLTGVAQVNVSGVVVEEGPAKELIDHPQEERTKQFLAHYSE